MEIKNLKWIVIPSVLIITLAFGYIMLEPGYFEIYLNDGDQLAKYKDGVFKMYSGRYIVLEDYVSPECYYDRAYHTVYKARGNKYSNLSYSNDTDGNHYIKQTIFYSRGNLTRYFTINDYSIKESFEWNPNNPEERCRLRIKYSGLEKDLGELLYSSNQKIYNFETPLEFGMKFDWTNDAEKISMVDRYDNGNLHILTSPVTGSFEYDPEVQIKEKPKEVKPKQVIKTEYTYNSKIEEWQEEVEEEQIEEYCKDGFTCSIEYLYDQPVRIGFNFTTNESIYGYVNKTVYHWIENVTKTFGNAIIYSGMRYADSSGTTIEEASSLKDCEFCNKLKLNIEDDGTHKVNIIDYNYTSLTAEIYYDKDNLQEYESEIDDNKMKTKIKILQSNGTLESEMGIEIEEGKSIIQTIPFGINKELHIGENSTITFFNVTSGAGTVAHDTTGWSSSHDAETGSSVSTTELNAWVVQDAADYLFERAFFPINTSELPSYATVSEASICIFIDSGERFDGDNDGDDFLVILNSSQASVTSLTTADYDQCGSIDNPTELSNRIDITDITEGVYTCFTLDSSGMNWINKSGYSRFCAREGHDVDDSQISGGSVYKTGFDWDSTTLPTGIFLNATYTIPDVFYNLTITDPTTSSPESVNPSDKLTIRFNLTEVIDGISETPLTSGVTQENVTVGGDICVPSTNNECSGTANACSTYPDQASCNLNGTGCSWSEGSGQIEQTIDYEEFITDLGDWTCSGCARSASNNQCGASGTSDIGTTAGTDEMYMNIDATGVDNITLHFTMYQASFEAGDCLQIECDDNDVITIGESGCDVAQTDNTAVTYHINLTVNDCDAYDSSTKISFQGAMNSAFDDAYIDCVNLTNTSGSPSACSGSVNDCNNANYINQSSCTGAGCVYGAVNEFVNNDLGWELNCTVPAGCTGLSDLFVNATYDSITYNETQVNAVNCGGASNCWDSSPLTADCEIDCTENADVTGTLDCDGYSITTTNKGQGSSHFDYMPINCAGVTLLCYDNTLGP